MNPEFTKWPIILHENEILVSRIHNRSKWRDEIINDAIDYTQDILGLKCSRFLCNKIIATGHQAIWHHCGILAKNAITHNFAKSVKGIGLHLILDHDISDTSIILPKKNNDSSWDFEQISIESIKEKNNIVLEYRRVPAYEKLKYFANKVIGVNKNQICNNIWENGILNGESDINMFGNIANLITYFQAIVNSALGLNILYLPVSKLCSSDAFFSFLSSITFNTNDFINCYNNGLRNVQEKFNSYSMNGIAPLINNDDYKELPFWLISPKGERSSLWLKPNGKNNIQIGTSKICLGDLDSSSIEYRNFQLKKILDNQCYYLRPKAVTLTLFTRLYFADFFVHGVGACCYESITDYLLEHYYNITQLKYGTATSTMNLSFNENNDDSDNIKRLKNKLRNVQFNPEKYINRETLENEAIKSLIKMKNIKIYESLNSSLSSCQRRNARDSVSKINRELSVYTKKMIQEITLQIAEAQKKIFSKKVFNYREYFFGLFPEDRLRKLINLNDY